MRSIGERMGGSEDSLREYPRVEAVLRDIVGPRARLARQTAREEELVALAERFLDASRDGARPTQRDLAAGVGVSLATLLAYPQVRALLAGVAAKRGATAAIVWRESPDRLRELSEMAADPNERKRLQALWLVP